MCTWLTVIHSSGKNNTINIKYWYHLIFDRLSTQCQIFFLNYVLASVALRAKGLKDSSLKYDIFPSLQDFSTGKELENWERFRTLRSHSFKWTLATAMAPMTSCSERQTISSGRARGWHTGGCLPLSDSC